jgi:hypothetical protein
MRLLGLCLAGLLLAGCRQAAPQGAPAESAERAAPQAAGVTLRPEELARAGIAVTPAAAAQHTPESVGYGVVVAREALAQSVAELSSAAAVERQSRAALARGRSLAGTPGAMSVESQDAAERQAAVDHAALVLAERRLSATYGRDAPWGDHYDSPLLGALASGETRLVRVTFPLGALGTTTPPKLRFSHLGALSDGGSFESASLWPAPADANIPGKSFFALVKASEASEGERLLARAPVGAAEHGAIVPFSAAVISDGQYWCYVETRPGVFVRTAIDTSMPTDEGYFVRSGVVPGARVVTRSAGELLARELNPGTAAAD